MIFKTISLVIGLQVVLAESTENDAAKKYGPKAEEFCNDFYDKDENTKVKYLGRQHKIRFRLSRDAIHVGDKNRKLVINMFCPKHLSLTSNVRRAFSEFIIGTLCNTEYNR